MVFTQGEVVEFFYDGGSTPGSKRRVRVDEVCPECIYAFDLDAQGLRRFNLDKIRPLTPTTPSAKVCFIITSDGTITLYINKKSYIINKDNPGYSRILDILHTSNYEECGDQLLSLATVKDAIISYVKSADIEIKNDEIYYKGSVVHNCLTERILDLCRNNYPFEPMLKFLENILENPSFRAVNELYKFLEHKGLPITSDGCFIGYKKVQDDYKDWYSGKYDNSVGAKPKMDRREVDEDSTKDCSYGFHIGTLEYARDDFHSGSGRIMICKVNPKDCVSVPSDFNFSKLRVCEYEVIDELENTTSYYTT